MNTTEEQPFLVDMNSSNLTGSVSSNSSILETTSKCAVENSSRSTKVLVITGFIVVLFSSVLGNSLLVRVVIGDKEVRRKFPFNYLIINMAIADILNASSASLVFILFLAIGRLWLPGVFGEITCKISYFLVIFSVAASILTFVVMGLDRFLAAHATIRPFSRKAVKTAIISIWFLAGIFGSPYLYRMGIKQGPNGEYYCVGYWSEDKEKHKNMLQIEEAIKIVALYFLPLIFMVIFYAIIALRIRKRSELPVDDNRKSKIIQQNQRVVRMIIVIVVIFAVCWFPVHVNHLLRSFDFPTYCGLPAFLPLSFFLLAHANCAVNPWIWFMFSGHFRDRLKKVISISDGKVRSDNIPLAPKQRKSQLQML
ncbi:tachykinin-like peptides receptor 99D isoform X2 [Montipora foliosa]|uniref:tachykinin-like peptides receptor 99D isoform X2 n=1 Tax=Montipora foliosa TaxID=591990 RepID=UPI0035F1CDC6